MLREAGRDSEGPLRTLVQHYTRGILALLAAFLVIRFIVAIWPAEAIEGFSQWLSGDGDRWIVAIAALVFMPTIIGWLWHGAARPLLARSARLRGLLSFEDKLVTELAPDAARGYAVVLIDWPSEDMRTMGVLTSTDIIPEDDKELAAVFLPGAPDPRKGTIRIVPREALEFTEWTLREFWSFQLSFGAAVPLARETESRDML